MAAVQEGRNVLCVSNTAFNLYNFRLGIMKALRDNGFAVKAAAPEDRFSEKLVKHGFHFIPVHCLKRKGTNPVEDLRLLMEFRRIYKKEKPALVLHFTVKPNIYGTIACRLLGIKSLCSITGLGYLFMKKGFLNAVAKTLYKTALSYSLQVAFQNEEDKNIFVRHNLVDEKKTFVTPGSGVDTAFFSPEEGVRVPQHRAGVIFLLVARMLWDKGVGEFVEAAKVVKARYGNTEFRLLGGIDNGNPSGISEPTIREWEGKDIITYLGVADDVRSFLSEADVAVLPSYYREGIPKSLLEAMAMRKPVITTDTPGCRDTVEGGENGFLVPAKDAHGLARAMMKMVEMGEEKRSAMGKRGRELVIKKFDEKYVVEAYLTTIRRALGVERRPDV